MTPYLCPTCGKEHADLPHIGSPAPYQWSRELADDPDSSLTDELCIIQGRDFFVRGVIEIPVHGYEYEFGWGVWVSHKKENFETYRDHFDSAEIGPFFGWLSTEISYFPESTLSLKTAVHYRGGSIRPRIVLAESGHPLYLHQHQGISLSEAWKIIHHYDPNL